MIFKASTQNWPVVKTVIFHWPTQVNLPSPQLKGWNSHSIYSNRVRANGHVTVLQKGGEELEMIILHFLAQIPVMSSPEGTSIFCLPARPPHSLSQLTGHLTVSHWLSPASPVVITHLMVPPESSEKPANQLISS